MAKPIPDDLYAVMRKNYDELIDFVISPPFKALVEKMYSLPSEQRPGFVKSVLLNSSALVEAGVQVPNGILIQRSAFGDGRPTLFVVKKYLPEGYDVVWENVNLTFDQNTSETDVPKDATAWKPPIPLQIQAALQAMGIHHTEIDSLRRPQS
jgi:hypothetical protein